MTDESPVVPLDDALRARAARPFTELTLDELMATKAAYAACRFRIVNSVPWDVVPLVAGAAAYAKAFLETLGKHNADWLGDAVRTRLGKNGEKREVLVGPEDGAATIVMSEDTPEEARLALLDLDVTAPDLRGKELHWDRTTGEWRPSREEKPPAPHAPAMTIARR